MRHTGRQLSLALLVLALGLMGMGGFGGGRETGLPQREFRATFTDVDGTRVEATRVTAGGDTNLEGEIGRGRLRGDLPEEEEEVRLWVLHASQGAVRGARRGPA